MLHEHIFRKDTGTPKDNIAGRTMVDGGAGDVGDGVDAMMGRHPVSASVRTQADELRDALSQCEEWVIQIKAGSRLRRFGGSAGSMPAGSAEGSGLALLRLLDRVADELDRLEQRGMDVRAERGRLESVLNQLRRRDKALVARVGTVMVDQRPPDARWWWFLPEKVATDRNRLIRRVIGISLAGLVLLVVFYLLYDRFVAPPPHIRQANRLLLQGEQYAIEGNLTGAIEQFESVVELDPENAEAYVWLGVLYQRADRADRAAAVFGQAQKVYENEIGFLLQRGLIYLVLGDVDAAREDAVAVIDLGADRPEGYYLLGNVYEQSGDLKSAIDSLQRAADLAEAAGQIELQATARLHLASVIQRFTTTPQQ